MDININIWSNDKKLDRILNNQEVIMTTQVEAAQQVEELTLQMKSIAEQVKAAVAKIEAAAGEASPELLAAIADAKATLQGFDDQVEDLPVV